MKRKRHWSRTTIGSDLWWDYLRELRVDRVSVESNLDLAHTAGRETIDPHNVQVYGSPAERAVTFVLLATYVPTYASFMYLSHAWSAGGRALKEWIVVQYAELVDTGCDAALYSLWVDYFEVPERARFVFPRLAMQVRRLDRLIADSGPVPWEVKLPVYEEAAAVPAMHDALARGLCGSFFDVYGSVDPPVARDLFRSIVVEDAERRPALEEVTTQPVRWRLTAVTSVDETDPRWTKWLHREEPESSCLVALEAVERRRSWVRRSDLLCEGRRLGRLVHYAFPFDPAIRHRVYGAPGDPQHTVVFRLAGSELAARACVGEVVDAWPPGLAPI